MHTGEQSMKITCHMRSSGHLCAVSTRVENAESFNKRDWMSIEEATETSYTERNSLSFPFYTDCIIIVG